MGTMKKIRTIGVVAFKKSPRLDSTLARIQRWASRSGMAVLFHPLLKGRVRDSGRAARSEAAFLAASDAFLSLGGDGTFLSMVHMCRFGKKPVAGVNLGGLGFLTRIGEEDLEDGLGRIAAGRYTIVRRMALDIELQRRGRAVRRCHALNDLFVNRLGRPRLLSIGAWYGRDFITIFQGDGIIVATPSGSTAYSLAAGGPIMEPTVDAFLLAPICPHSLTERPMVLPSGRFIRLRVDPGDHDAVMSADGLDTVRLAGNDEIIVSRSHVRAAIMQVSPLTCFDLLRRKLDWGRNYKQRDAGPDAA